MPYLCDADGSIPSVLLPLFIVWAAVRKRRYLRNLQASHAYGGGGCAGGHGGGYAGGAAQAPATAPFPMNHVNPIYGTQQQAAEATLQYQGLNYVTSTEQL